MVTEQKITYTATPDQIKAMHATFDQALKDVEQDLGKTYPMIIGGKDVTGRKLFEVRDPANTDLLLGKFQSGTKQDVDAAVAAAKATFPAWSHRPWRERVEIIHKAAGLIRERKFRLASLLILECGKSRAEAIGEIEEGADLLTEYARQMEEHKGFVQRLESLDPAEKNRSVLRPFGVWAVLAPFNFPFALSAGMSSGALVAGNTVVFKPASATPISGYELARCFLDGGVPDGVFNYITGSGEEVGEPLATHPDVDGAIFTGSKEVGFDLFKRFSTEFPKPFIAEMGGKNPTIVTRHADLDKAVEGIVRAAFGYSGQKCSACSRAYVEAPVYGEFMDRLVKRTEELKVGDPVDKDVFVGSVIDQRAVKRFEEAIKSVDGGTVRTGGKHLTEGEYARGYYVEPTIVDGLPLDHPLFKSELFVPLLVVGNVDSLDQAIDESNDTEYGLTAGIFTEDQDEIKRFFDRIQAGVVYANRKGGATTGAWPGCQSFAGWKGSGTSGKGGLGPFYVQQFLREQSQTVVVEDENDNLELFEGE